MEHDTEDVWVYTGQQGEVPATARSVLIAENITRIPDEAFKQHQGLEEVILSSSVQVIGKRAFRGCKKLKFIFHHGLGQEKKLGIPANVKVIDDRAFQDCKSFESLILNEGLERIGEFSFDECESLKELHFPSTVTAIGGRAFQDCK
eukprot:scaffold2124_cov66-Cylindrotheca_fusiformis.AAC.1